MAFRGKKTISTEIEFAQKVFDTLAMLLPASCSAVENTEENKNAICTAVKAKKIRLVLHFEQPKNKSKLFPRKFDLINIQTKLKNYLKSIDPHPIVMDCLEHCIDKIEKSYNIS